MLCLWAATHTLPWKQVQFERAGGSTPQHSAIIQSNIWLIILVVEIDGYSILLITIPRQTLIFDFVLKYIANISMAG